MNQHIQKPFEDTAQLRREIIEAYVDLSRLGFCIGTWGNISVRVHEGLLITPSRIDCEQMSIDDLVLVSWEGQRLKGHAVPSSEMQLHRLMLLNRPDMGAVVHTHSPYASGIACARKSIPAIIEDMAQIIGGEVKCAEYSPGGRHADLANAAVEAMGKDSAAVLLANHGPVVAGRDLAEAVVAAQVLEKAARVYLYATSAGGCTSIPAEFVSEERDRYLYKYGREEDSAAIPEVR